MINQFGQCEELYAKNGQPKYMGGNPSNENPFANVDPPIET